MQIQHLMVHLYHAIYGYLQVKQRVVTMLKLQNYSLLRMLSGCMCKASIVRAIRQCLFGIGRMTGHRLTVE